ncbi:Gfo/Idh/MocA family protein [Negadavirga shengliensis]|uniref:Gfo/Idh/MocA family protein n=1 Tax=Negadavirga shengliensis TaxID=1389218 RepID=A0ABV9T6I9_9BACT
MKKPQRKTRLGFIGVGWIGLNRLKAVSDSGMAEICQICEPSEINAKAALQACTNGARIRSEDEIINDPEIDGVVIATPSALHARQAINALEAGKAVFCQKPLGCTSTDVQKILDAAKDHDKLLEVDFSYRHCQAFRYLMDTVKSGNLGEIFAVDLVFHNAYGPDKNWYYDTGLSGGGCVMDLGIHLLDMAFHCLSFPEIIDVQSDLFHQGRRLAKNKAHNQPEDYAHVCLQSPGTSFNLQCSWNLHAGKDAIIKAVFYGTKGGAAFKNSGGSFYEFRAEKYEGTKSRYIDTPDDDWGGRAGIKWLQKLHEGRGYDPQVSKEILSITKTIDRIYGRG